MYRAPSDGSQILRRFVQQAESYNRCMFPQDSTTHPIDKQQQQRSVDRVTEQILFCQNGIDNLTMSSSESNPSLKRSDGEILLADIVSTGYKYETSSFELNTLQQCCVISVISPYAFTIQLTRDLADCDIFFKAMNDFYNSNDELHISSEYLRKNLLCVTWDETAASWNRSQIMEFDLIDDMVNVFFVDLNSWEEHVSRSRLRFILTKYASRPVRLLTCRLASIGPLKNENDWNEVVSKTFQNVVNNCPCDVEPIFQARNETFYVNLFASHDEAYVCVNDFLIHCRMARPIDDISNEKNLVYMLDDDARPMHSMIALYWKAGEAMREAQAEDDPPPPPPPSTPEKSASSRVSLTKVVMIDEQDKIIFARYNTYIMLPSSTISLLLNGLDEESIKIFAIKCGFKPISIDPLSDPLLCSQLRKLLPAISTPMNLYSIDCARKIFQAFRYTELNVYELLDRARLAEASDDSSFWDKSQEILPAKKIQNPSENIQTTNVIQSNLDG